MSTKNILTGKTKDHLTNIANTKHSIHKDALHDFLQLQMMAMNDGFKLEIASSWRSYSDQLNIWNQKAKGKRALRDRNGVELNYNDLNTKQIMDSILRWSAIPGCSRHHWGSDIDVFDGNACPQGYSVQLTPQEVQGMFKPFHDWLSEKIYHNKSFGFFRPYEKELGGVSPEMWHLSYRPLSENFLKNFNFELFQECLCHDALELQTELKKDPLFIYKNYVTNITLPQWP